MSTGGFLNSGVIRNFPGANSISFDYNNMQTIQSRKTVVCEKTDGVRFFLCEVAVWKKERMDQPIFLLVDREYNFRRVLPTFDILEETPSSRPNKETHFQLRNVLDGELVIDNKWREGERKSSPIFLVFDALIVNNSNLMYQPFTRRLIDANAYMQNRFTKARIFKSFT